MDIWFTSTTSFLESCRCDKKVFNEKAYMSVLLRETSLPFMVSELVAQWGGEIIGGQGPSDSSLLRKKNIVLAFPAFRVGTLVWKALTKYVAGNF